MMKWLRLIAAWIGGIIVGTVLFVGLMAGCKELVAIHATATYSVATPDAGWNGLMLLYFASPFVAVASGAAGIFFGIFLNNKMRPRIRHADQKGPAS